MLSRIQKIRHAIAGRLPYTRASGRRAHAQGRGRAWVNRAKLASEVLDILASFLLLGSAALALAALWFANGWLAACGGIAMGLAMIAMSGTLWIDKKATDVEEHVHAFRHPRKQPSEGEKRQEN